MTDPITLDELRDLAETKGVLEAIVMPQNGGYTVHVPQDRGERLLISKDGTVIVFATYEEAIAELDRTGVPETMITHAQASDASSHDTSASARRIAESLEYDDWVRERVDEAFQDEALGLSDWKSHEEVWENVRAETERMIAERDAAKGAGTKPASKKKGGV
ncbi:hypothetical protein L2Y96_21960 [Luteibacter aegosomaticola]|uniref:hypothetical protein n=1 Tax=Luteibacter aegosomaticola TaxID=2911538 RepID=UPI001FFA4388|nr:hypothetical protein [Luteibacter aegosomaticola]UPG90010.1 hypothetical protein L2Y96_21960 [Luteibacter aegosomaticola]